MEYPLGRERSPSLSHLPERNRVGAEGEAGAVARIGLGQGGDAHVPSRGQDVGDPRLQLHPDRRHVDRVAERHLGRDHARVVALVVDHRVGTAARAAGGQREGTVQNRGGHGDVAVGEGGRVGEELELGAGLPGPGDHIDLPPGGAGPRSPDPGQDIAGPGILGHQSAGGHVHGGALGHGLGHQLLGLLVEGWVEAGLDAQAHRLVARPVPALEPALHRINEVRRQVERAAPRGRQGGCLGEDGGGLSCGQVSLSPHGRHHQLLALAGRREIVEGVEVAGLGQQAGQQRGLVGVQLSSVHPEVGLGGGLDPGRPLAEVDIVEVFLEDGGAREFGGQLLAEKNLLDFVGERLVVVEVEDLAQLLRNGAGALGRAVVNHVVEGGLGDPGQIEAGRSPEVAVLDRDHRLAHHRRDLLIGNGDAAAPGRMEVGDLNSSLAVDQGVATQISSRGQRSVGSRQSRERHRQDHHRRHRGESDRGADPAPVGPGPVALSPSAGPGQLASAGVTPQFEISHSRRLGTARGLGSADEGRNLARWGGTVRAPCPANKTPD